MTGAVKRYRKAELDTKLAKVEVSRRRSRRVGHATRTAVKRFEFELSRLKCQGLYMTIRQTRYHNEAEKGTCGKKDI